MDYTCGPTAIGAWVAPGQTKTTMIFVILVSKSYIKTMDRRDFGGKQSNVEVRTGAIVISEFYSVGGARSKNNIFRVFDTLRLSYT